FSKRVNAFLSDKESGKILEVKIADKKYELKATDSHGFVYQEIRIDKAVIEKHAVNNFVQITLMNKGGKELSTKVKLVPDKGTTIISDIDDTVKISNVTSKKKLMQSTFMKAFTFVDGMAKAYRESAYEVQFVSSSPYQLYPELCAAFDTEKFPWAQFHMKKVRLTNSSLFDLFKKGTESKPVQIEAIIKRWPNRQYILIGDDGEQDPEVYAGIKEKYPKKIIGIYIRTVSNRKLPDGMSAFKNGKELQKLLKR
ncbi:MAG: DUF2183 domain-containing protein, partial [Lentisphaeria bacterium]|nr:DUF2183 domain-containing protein [Lentisphaeria bacterium]